MKNCLYKFDDCDENFGIMKDVTDHRQEAHPRMRGKTTQCLKMYMSSSDLAKHITTKHSPASGHDECTQAFAYDSQLKAHKKKHTQQKEKVCPQNTCQYTLSIKGNMELHQQIHDEQE